VRPLRKFVRTTDSDHDGPIFPNRARGFISTGPDQLWVGDITYIRIAAGFVYLAVILDAWSRRVVGYALGRQIDTRFTLAALRAAVDSRQPQRGCIHHSDRGVQYAAELYRRELAEHGLIGSMSRRGNPYDNGKAESFMKTIKCEEVYLNDYRTYADVNHQASRLHRRGIQHPQAALGARLSLARAVRGTTHPHPGPISRLRTVQPVGFTPIAIKEREPSALSRS
jgi:putative transposase